MNDLPPDLIAAIEHGRAHPEEAVEIDLTQRPDIRASIQNAREHPETLVRRTLRDAKDIDWEDPDAPGY